MIYKLIKFDRRSSHDKNDKYLYNSSSYYSLGNDNNDIEVLGDQAMENRAPEVISVIYNYNGILDHVKSFIILDPSNENKRSEIIAECEQYFIDAIKDHVKNYPDDFKPNETDLNDYLDQGGFSDDSGIDLYICWSI